MRCVLLSTLLLLLAATSDADSPGAAEHPAAIPTASRARAEVSFERFAADWMDRARALEERHKKGPSVQAGAREPVFTYRGYGDGYSTELRPTGHDGAPYVGLLRYTEHVYSCESARGLRCRVASTVPITEIFRYREGRWDY